jgi:hypothetical protein
MRDLSFVSDHFSTFQLCKLHLELELSFVMLWECAGGLMPRLLEEA